MSKQNGITEVPIIFKKLYPIQKNCSNCSSSTTHQKRDIKFSSPTYSAQKHASPPISKDSFLML